MNRQHSNKPELLAPAGDTERLEAAVQYGADAVYLGGKAFGMRSSPQNFDADELAQAVAFCHGQGVRVYVTCNILPTNEEIDQLPDFLRYAEQIGVDALIVADVGILALAKRLIPSMEIHISTQAGVVNYLTARELYAMGAGRVVLARELSLEDIAVIRDKTPPELMIESFVHGAMCMSFSGRCLISQYLTGRDGNRGACAQPCRWQYALVEEKRPGLFFPIGEEDGGSYILNAQDLSMLPHLDKLSAAGVDSFKIEGRAKSAYYVAAVTNAYRMAIDLYAKSPDSYLPPDWLVEETKKVSHRQYSTGFYFPENPPQQYTQSGGYIRDWDVVATVAGWQNGMLAIVERNRFFRGDVLELLEPGQQPVALAVADLFDEEGQPVEAAVHPMSVFQIPCERPVVAGAILRKKRG